MKLLIIVLLTSIINTSESVVLLYDTEIISGKEETHCIYYVKDFNIKYCVRVAKNKVIPSYNNYCSNGEQWKFSKLLHENISPWEVLSWSSSIELAENYAHIYYNRSINFDENESLCKCTEQSSFGINCEYQLLFNSSVFSDAIQITFEAKENTDGHQMFGSILCYETLICDFGRLCLDWRNICDRMQNCMNGIDEENCHLLEFNECEIDEYRCINGMCIPHEYWLDGQYDCMDWSDEISSPSSLGDCALKPFIIDCDDHLCSDGYWSCGDGQCIRMLTRHIYQSFFSGDLGCYSMREYFGMCEAAAHTSLWTVQHGVCAKSGYDDTLLITSPQFDYCLYLVRCALSKGAEIHCPCNGVNCSILFINNCPNDEVLFPFGGIIRPWLVDGYLRDRSWENTLPDRIYIIGSYRCRGFMGNITTFDHYYSPADNHIGAAILERFICRETSLINRDSQSLFQYSNTCWNDSLTFNGQPYAFTDFCQSKYDCYSQYRIRDGYSDCLGHEDEGNHSIPQINYCHHIQKHRFQCSSQQLTCFSARHLAEVSINDFGCINKYDKFIKGDGRALNTMMCKKDNDYNECQSLRYYIGNSSIINETFKDDQDEDIDRSSTVKPFRYYCDSFWDEAITHRDEDFSECQMWICNEQQFQCRTGQCIELEWVCDGEWDCSDASDEFNLNGNLSNHNKNLVGLNERKTKCPTYNAFLPFFNICNFDYEYPCYRSNVSNPLDIDEYRPCISHTQIGDRIEDCYGGIDEKNVFEDCQSNMLGYTLRCNNTCQDYNNACLRGNCMTSPLCFYKNMNVSSCSNPKDVICLNGTCIPNGRCDKIHQCLHGEDEHWCTLHTSLSDFDYRHDKRSFQFRHIPKIHLLNFPKENYSGFQINTHQQEDFRDIPSQLPEKKLNGLLYICNQGFTAFIPATYGFLCLCPPTYYGSFCQFFSDRLSIITYLDLTTLPNEYLTNSFIIVATLHLNNNIEDHHLFYINPSILTHKSIKQRFYLLYSRTNNSLQYKIERYFNGIDILNHHPYSVHFDIFSLTNDRIDELGSFIYPIYFDFLPVFRLATILRFPPWFRNSTLDPCYPDPCNENSSCVPILNQNNSFRCSCKSGYSGNNCQNHYSECESYCAPTALCRPGYRGEINGPILPLCICPLGSFGPRCYIRNEVCESNPCGINSTCHATYDPSGEKPFFCVCPQQYYGDQCQYEKVPVYIHMNLTSLTDIAVSVIQFYNTTTSAISLKLLDQQVTHGIPKIIRYNHSRETSPPIALLKTYNKLTNWKYFILYSQSKSTRIINITSTPEECPNVLILLSQMNIKSSSTTNIFKYHQICRNNTNQICFYDRNYFCFCRQNHYGVNCFQYDLLIDKCNQCFLNGKCIKGDLEDPNDFICLCRSCHQGRLCEFSLEAFGFTLDSLLISSLTIIQSIYIGLAFILFLIGFLTNLCAFVTFQRKQSRKFGVGNYLLVTTILNQLSLFCLFFKFLHVLLGAKGKTNDISCKIISYLLSILTRSTYWLTSWVTIDRLFIVLYPRSTILKKPLFSIYIIIITLFILCLMHSHEILFYKTIHEPNSSTLLCIPRFDETSIAIYNRINTLIHYLLPFSIQFISITLLIIHAARSRSKTSNNKITLRQLIKKQLFVQKELYITPIIIIVAALPQAILSFSLACIELNDFKRHLLLSTFLLSYSPQILGFILYVVPSSVFMNEFKQTKLAKKYLHWIIKSSSK
ncbi:unnamed protein product [Adineta steineri]|uniref:Uncharacterized protein n=1 Tax=Adineta steineri TaxID=433720 RepID=A0A815NWX9_9BILA|nr:unnamed protein product [Adineta steineri]CAF4005944.1 unnamed protein product [Adineta steineri]